MDRAQPVRPREPEQDPGNHRGDLPDREVPAEPELRLEMRRSRVHERPPSSGGGWSCGVRARVSVPAIPSSTCAAVAGNGRRTLRLARAAGSAFSPKPAVDAAPSENAWARTSGLAAARVRIASRWSARPLAERLVGEVLPRPWPVVGDQAPHRALGRGGSASSAWLACSADTGCSLLTQRRLQHLRVEVLLAPARTLQTTARRDRALLASQRRRRVRTRVRGATDSLQPT